MRYGSICSGIEAATVAWEHLGWEPVFFAEIDQFPSAVLKHHYPDVPNHGDFTTIGADDYGTIGLLVGGTPCQDYSIAGKREGMDGRRGSLTLEFVRLIERKRPVWFLWENVPGVMSSNGGRDFGTFIGDLAKCGYGFAYRVLDAQYFGVAQRRKRVFVVGYLGDWRPPAAVLFEWESMCGNPAPSREQGQSVARDVAHYIRARGNDSHREDSSNYVVCSDTVGTLCADTHPGNYTGKDAYTGRLLVHGTQDPCYSDIAFALGRNNGQENVLLSGCDKPMAVRRLTPIECERLQGFPDNYTNIPFGRPKYDDQICPDGHRYKALGNSMAVPVMRWLGERIQMVDDIVNNKSVKGEKE